MRFIHLNIIYVFVGSSKLRLVLSEAKACGILWYPFISHPPTEEKISLFSELNDPDLFDNCDNITVAPSGDLVLCEDGGDRQYLDIITPQEKNI